MERLLEFLPVVIFIIAIVANILRSLSGQQENTPPKKNPTPQSKPTTGQKTFSDTLEDLIKSLAPQVDPNLPEKKETKRPEKKTQVQIIKEQKEEIAYKEHGITEKQRNQDQHFEPFKVSGKKKKQARKAVNLLKNPETLRQVFIATEIFQRKF